MISFVGANHSQINLMHSPLQVDYFNDKSLYNPVVVKKKKKNRFTLLLLLMQLTFYQSHLIQQIAMERFKDGICESGCLTQ